MTIRVIATNAEEVAAVRDALAEGVLAEVFGEHGVTAWQSGTGSGEVSVGATAGAVGRHRRLPGPAVPVS